MLFDKFFSSSSDDSNSLKKRKDLLKKIQPKKWRFWELMFLRCAKAWRALQIKQQKIILSSLIGMALFKGDCIRQWISSWSPFLPFGLYSHQLWWAVHNHILLYIFSSFSFLISFYTSSRKERGSPLPTITFTSDKEYATPANGTKKRFVNL